MPLQPASPAAAAAPKLSSLEQRWWLPHVVLLCCQLAFAVMHVSSHAVRDGRSYLKMAGHRPLPDRI